MRSLPSPSPPATAGDMFERISDIENWGKLLPTPRRGAIMENKIGDDAKHAEIGIERDDEVDYVSAWIMSVAIGMIVLGAMFVVLDRNGFFSTGRTPPETMGSLSAITR
jgi:hypothetical protein